MIQGKTEYFYKRASGKKRIATRLFDLLIVATFLFFVNFLANLHNLTSWLSIFGKQKGVQSLAPQYFNLAFIFAFITPLVYFVGLAYCFNCQTWGKKIARIRVVDQKTLKKPLLKNFIRHEFLISILPSFCMLGFYIFFLSTQQYTIGALNYNNYAPEQKSIFVIIQTIYGLTNIIDLFIVIFLLTSRKKIAFHDLMSHTWTINTQKYHRPIERVQIIHTSTNPLEIFRKSEQKVKVNNKKK